jgi:integrating conjugative element membrane protein (TIGR03747 family)
MATTQKGEEEGVREFFWLFSHTFSLAVWLCLMLLLAIVADLLAAHFLWRDDPVAGIENLMRFYLDQSTAPQLSQKCADWAYQALFGWDGIDRIMRQYADGTPPDGMMGRLLTHDAFGGPIASYVSVAMYGAKLFGIRVAMLAMILPQFALILAVAFVDGLVERYIRRECGGNESATRFHHAKRFTKMALAPLVILVWLVSPWPLYVHWLFYPIVLISAIAIRIMAKYYKKYL